MHPRQRKQFTTEQRQTEHQLVTAPTQKVGVSCSADTFLVNQSLVLSFNICGESPT
jgi:hypothetical protein